MLILPPFQGEGHGAQLLEAVHRFYCSLPKVQDITGENLVFFFLFFYIKKTDTDTPMCWGSIETSWIEIVLCMETEDEY